MVNPPLGMHVCPTRVDGQPVLFAHAITPGMCQDRQRGLYHKCFTCVHNNAHGEAGMKASAAFAKLPQPAKVSAG